MSDGSSDGSSDDGSGRTGQGATGAEDQDAAQEQVRSEGDRMARKLVQDVAAYEVDPPPPARVEDDPR